MCDSILTSSGRFLKMTSPSNSLQGETITSSEDHVDKPDPIGSFSLKKRMGGNKEEHEAVIIISAPTLTPFNINRWILISFYCIYSMLCGPSYFCWASLRSMLDQTGAYQWLCLPSDDDGKLLLCEAQHAAVQLLYTLAGTSHFVTSAAAGTVMDSFGAKITGLLGIFLQIVGWILIGSSSQTFQAYIPGFLIMGMGMDASFLPCISAANLFPKYISFVIAMLGAFRSLSFVLIVIMETALGTSTNPATFTTISYIFALVFLGFCFIMVVFLIPWKPFPPLVRMDTTQQQDDKIDQHISARRRSSLHSYMGLEDWKDIASSVVRNAPSSAVLEMVSDRQAFQDDHEDGDSSHHGEQQHEKDHHGDTWVQKGEPYNKKRSVSGILIDTTSTRGQSEFRIEPVVTRSRKHSRAMVSTKIHRNDPKHGTGLIRELSIAGGGDRAHMGSFISIASASVAVFKKQDQLTVLTRSQRILSFVSELRSIFFLPVLLVLVFSLQRMFFFNSVSDKLMSESSISFFKVMTPLSLLPCPFLGFLADKVGIIPVMMIVNFSGAMIIGFLMIPGIPAATACQYLSSVMFVFHVSFLLSQLYCYVADVFAPENMGKLIGIISASAGLIGLTSYPMTRTAVNSFPNDKTGMFSMMGYCLLTSVLNFGLLGLVWVAKVKRVRERMQIVL